MSPKLPLVGAYSRAASEFAIRERHLQHSLAAGDDTHLETSLDRLSDSFGRLNGEQQASALAALPERVQRFLRGELQASEVHERVDNWLALQARLPTPVAPTTPEFDAAQAIAHMVEASSIGKLDQATAEGCIRAFAKAAALDPTSKQINRDLRAFAQRLSQSPDPKVQALAAHVLDSRVRAKKLAKALKAPAATPPVHVATTPLSAEAWTNLSTALRKQKTPDAIEAALVAQGFAKGDAGAWRRGDETITVRPMHLAQLDALEITAGSEAGCLVNGALVLPEQLQQMKTERDDTLARYLTARRFEHLTQKPVRSLDEIKRFVRLGGDSYERMALFADKRFFLDKKKELTQLLTQVRERGLKIALCFEGHDAAGKTSTGKVLVDALRSAGFDMTTISFKGPTEAERQEPAMKRFERAFDANTGALIMDRTFAGNWAYGNPPSADLDALHALEQKVKDSGTIVVKFLLAAEKDRQAATFGRRWARHAIATELAAAPQRTAEERSQLLDLAGISPNDMPSFVDEEEIKARFASFAPQNGDVFPWHQLDTTSRVDASTRAIDIVIETLRAAVAG